MASNYWCLSENDSEEEKAKEEASSVDYMELGGLTIPPWRVLQLMQVTGATKHYTSTFLKVAFEYIMKYIL